MRKLQEEPPDLDRAYVQFLEQADQLWEWRFKRRLAELRGSRSDDWLGGHHIPSMLWAGMQMCCWFAEELWSLEPNPWAIKKDAEATAYDVFVEEVRNGGKGASSSDRSKYIPRGGR